ncbi:PEP-CTERM sorting domain-containing protein [Cerasicoccus arenae]|uniref:Ice-binding protein C-terminal domain-containing protein n=1 Tax=Cerasicoccus arenae TaxID=424488 RepID=A0A8J3DDC4_9BACT|nr:PEP-CTERM sorting domain-containing protein [Cerasicoccus arenae]MBK1859862.1 PEP-CTERM sorting domain-containing protein [Cerasicoccus arenae]GHC13425.1 hypothetical protein GCM10007047_33490 [Cerasicoccus arenae]
MNTSKLIPILAIAATSSTSCFGVTIYLDFGPTATSTPANSPYTTSGTPTWNTVGVTDVAAGSILDINGSIATGVSLDIGSAAGSGSTPNTTLSLSSQPTSSSNLGGIYNTGIYAGSSVGTDGIFNSPGGNTQSAAVGFQIGGLDAGIYEVYVAARNTSRTENDGIYSQTVSVGSSSSAGNFSYLSSSGSSGSTTAETLNYNTVSSTSAWIEDSNYLKYTITLAEGGFLNLAVLGGGVDRRGFLNSVQVVSIPEPSSFAALFGLATLAFLVRRRFIKS